MKTTLILLQDKGSAKKGYKGEYGEEEAKRLLDAGIAKKYVAAPKKKPKPTYKED